jgi:hypothetical protein
VAHPQIAAFARLATGSAKAIRSISGQNTQIARSVHDMAYDPVRDEIYFIQPHAHAILVFKGDANGDVPPLRKIIGPKTQIVELNEAIGRLALDTVNHEICVPVGPKVLIFPQTAEGDVAPIRVLQGPDTQMYASTCTIDPVHNLLIVAGRSPGWGRRLQPIEIITDTNLAARRKSLDGDDSIGQILIFDRTASGNTKPLRIIRGAKTLLSTTQFIMATYPPKGWILGGVWGATYGETAESSEEAMVGVFSIYDSGNVAPHWTIGGPHGILRQARGVTLDVKHKTVIISDKQLNAVLSFELPELF